MDKFCLSQYILFTQLNLIYRVIIIIIIHIFLFDVIQPCKDARLHHRKGRKSEEVNAQFRLRVSESTRVLLFRPRSRRSILCLGHPAISRDKLIQYHHINYRARGIIDISTKY